MSCANYSPLQLARLEYLPRMPPLLRGVYNIQKGPSTSVPEDEDEIKALFPTLFGQSSVSIVQNRGDPLCLGQMMKVGIVLAGGPAPGGHNVICGLLDHILERNNDSKMYGFLNGTSGLVKKSFLELTPEIVKPFRNQGGFHMLGSDRTKLETEEDFATAREVVTSMELDGLVFVGGYDTNANAMYAAENFKEHGVKTRVVSVPSTVDGDLRNEQVQTSIGFDTVSKVYSELTANLGHDANSAKKTYHFVRVMGRHASHVALEVALETRPNLCILGEEVEQRNLSLRDITVQIADLIVERARLGKHYGLILLPEGLVGFIPDLRSLIEELNEILPRGIQDEEEIIGLLSAERRAVYQSLPPSFASQLLFERDPYGNCQVSRTEVERLLMATVQEELAARRRLGKYDGKFTPIAHYFGYEGRCSLPSNFDCNYSYSLGHTAGALLDADCSGYAASVSGLTAPPEKWICGGYPLTMMMHMERRKGQRVATVKRSVVDLGGIPFSVFREQRDSWRLVEDYRVSGPIQHSGAMADAVNFTLQAELLE